MKEKMRQIWSSRWRRNEADLEQQGWRGREEAARMERQRGGSQEGEEAQGVQTTAAKPTAKGSCSTWPPPFK